jgi:hypothetical protein
VVVVVMMMVVMIVVMVMMMVVMMVMHLGGHRRRPGGRGGRRFLREGVTGEAERERGRNDKTLDHVRTSFLWLDDPNGSPQTNRACRLNSI